MKEMFEDSSRYANLPNATYTLPDGREIAFKRRRFLPQSAALPLLAEVDLAEGERLDVVAARVLGDAEQFWRVCDANDAFWPEELENEAGRALRVPMPMPEG